MSRKYPRTTTCPHCRLVVRATQDGQVRSHARLAREIAPDSVCAGPPVNPSRRDPLMGERAAADFRRQAEQQAYIAADFESRLPPHLR